jgi:putative sigma-54 modulation protein
MKVSYKGIKKDLPARLQEKLDVKFAKLSKLMDGDGEKRAHVIVTGERHLHKAEITVHTRDHELIGMGADADLFTAISGALGKIEKQAMKQGAKFRATTRRPETSSAPAAKPPAGPPKTPATPRVYRPNHHERRKPITLEEAVLEMEDGRDYLVYRDADKQSVFMLVRRRDGHFDLIES